jgi:DNA-binding transcriptional LysR family regulator
VLAVDLGGFARAARRVGRTQSAVSPQMRRLEDGAGQSLFTRAGRSFALTTAGEQVLGYARRLAINDEAVAALCAAPGSRARCGSVLADFAETRLPPCSRDSPDPPDRAPRGPGRPPDRGARRAGSRPA